MQKSYKPLAYQLILLSHITLLMGAVPGLAWAAAETLTIDHHLEAVPAVVYTVTAISAFLGGLAGTLHRMAQHLEPEHPIKHPKLFVVSNILAGLVAGWFAFFSLTQMGTPTLLVQGLVLVASFGGASVVERAIDKFFPAKDPRV